MSPDTVLDIATVTRRFQVLTGLRWLATGLLVPLLVVLFTSRGLDLAEFGLLATVMTVVTFVLELPTGGLADALGRRRVLLASNVFWLGSYVLLYVVALGDARPPLLLLAGVAVTTGVHRALESGPLDAWFVDAVRAIDPGAEIEDGLGRAGRMAGIGIATGSALASAALAVDPWPSVEPMAVVVAVSIVLVLCHTGAVWVLMTEVRPPLGRDALRDSVTDVPRVVRSSLRLLRDRRTLRWLMAAQITTSIGMIAFENLYPVRMSTLIGDPDDAGIVLGVNGAIAWTLFGLAAGAAAHLSRRLGGFRAGMAIRTAQAVTILTMAAAGGPIALAVAFVATYAVFGVTNPVHLALVHAQVDAAQRATVLSLHSMVAFASFAATVAGVGWISDHWSPAAAMVVCAVACLPGVWCYRRAERAETAGVAPRPLGGASGADPITV